jgi:hypothetical protein
VTGSPTSLRSHSDSVAACGIQPQKYCETDYACVIATCSQVKFKLSLLRVSGAAPLPLSTAQVGGLLGDRGRLRRQDQVQRAVHQRLGSAGAPAVTACPCDNPSPRRAAHHTVTSRRVDCFLMCQFATGLRGLESLGVETRSFHKVEHSNSEGRGFTLPEMRRSANTRYNREEKERWT